MIKVQLIFRALCRPHRLAWPRTLPFQGSNTGSNPVGDTKALSSANRLKADQSDRRQRGQEAGEKQKKDTEGGQSGGTKTIKGEVLRVEGNKCFIKGQDG